MSYMVSKKHKRIASFFQSNLSRFAFILSSALTHVQSLALPHNCIYGTIPPEIGDMTNLLSLELHGNGLSGEMPDEMFHLENLQLLNLGEQYGQGRECNKTDGRTVDIDWRYGGLPYKSEMNAGLTGKLDDRIETWRSLKGLYLHKNSFTGTISEEFGKLRYLRYLWLEDNFIEGSLPSTISKVKNLKWLLLGENFLVSSLPTDIGRLTDLERLAVNVSVHKFLQLHTILFFQLSESTNDA